MFSSTGLEMLLNALENVVDCSGNAPFNLLSYFKNWYTKWLVDLATKLLARRLIINNWVSYWERVVEVRQWVPKLLYW